MTFNSTNDLYGFPQPLTRVFPAPIISKRAPLTTDYKYTIGQVWVDEVGENTYTLVNVTANSATWNVTSFTPGNIDTLTGDSGGAISPSADNITLAGTANQITSIGSGSTITFSLIGPYTPATFTSHGVLVGAGTSSIAALTAASTGTLLAGSTGANPAFTGSPSVSGSLTAATTVTATLGAITATNGNLVLGTAGNKIVSTSVASTTTAGANSFGTVTLASGTATIATSAVTASSIIILTRMSPGSTGAAALGILSVGTITASTSFIINALTTADSTAVATTDVSSIGWMIIN